MRKVLAFVAVSADGYYLDFGRALDWQTQADEEFHQFLLEQLNQAGILLVGRVTYQCMAAAWPARSGQQPDPDLAAVITSMPKVVMSRTLTRADWPSTRVHAGPVDDELLRLREQSGEAVLVLGSSTLTSELLRDRKSVV